MKEIKISSIFIILILSVTFYTCTNDGTKSIDNTFKLKAEAQETKIPTDMGGLKYGNLVLPKGTISKVSKNGSRLDFKLPKNYIYAATDKEGKVFFAITGSYTCSSTCSGGCNVVKLGDVVGCSACPPGSTEPCTGSRGKSLQKNGLSTHQIGNGYNGGLINLNYGISFVSNTSNKRVQKGKSPNFNILIAYPKIKSEFDLFLKNIWNNKSPSLKDSKEVLVNVYGKVISLYIPIKMYKNSKDQFVSGSKISCNCSSGSSGCTLKPIKKGLFTVGHTCVAGSCTSCTMNW